MFTVKAEYDGVTRKFTYPFFPSWGVLTEQIYKVFRVDQYYLSHLLLSSESQGDERILIASEVHTPSEYLEHIIPFMDAYHQDGVLKFNVQDKVPRKQPSDRRRERSQAPMEIDDSEEPITSTLPAATPTAHRSHPHFDRHRWLPELRHRYPGPDESPYIDRWPRPRFAGRHHPHHHPRHHARPSRRGDDSASRPVAPAEEHEDPSRHASDSHWDIREELERIWSNFPRPALNATSPPQPVPNPEPSAKEEVSQLISTFVAQLNTTLTKHGMSEHSLSVSGGTESARSEVSTPTPETAPKAEGDVHQGYHCDYCLKTVRGVRYKCTNCHDFDLCEECVNVRFAKLDHNPYHHFTEISPGAEAPAPVTPVFPVPEDPVRHWARCDVCDATIFGVRHKCRNCSDYDMCSNCFEDNRGAHRLEHEFGSYATPEEVTLLHHPIRAPVPAPVPELVNLVDDSVPLEDTGSSARPSPASFDMFSHLFPTPSPVVHNATCDRCYSTIVGVRHKCLDCEDYDLCQSCFTEGSLQHFNDTHRFLRLHEARKLVVTRIYDDDDSGLVNEELRATLEDLSVRHDARCNLCESTIRGFRHRCIDCEDFDLCTSCIENAREAHDMSHTFVKFSTPGEILVHRRVESAVVPPVPEQPAPRDAAAHHNAICDFCNIYIVGDRFKCTRCPDFDACHSCFPLMPQEHPYHTFIKVSKPEQYIAPAVGLPSTVHPATCDSCDNHIIGVRFKCLHPDCPDYDLCQHCEALPIPVHPTTHPLVKFKDDYTEHEHIFDQVFEFVQSTHLKASNNANFSPPSVPSTPVPLHRVPEFEAIRVSSPMHRVPEDEVIRFSSPIEEKLFPTVPKEEPLVKLGESGAVTPVLDEAVLENENPFADPVTESEGVRPDVISIRPAAVAQETTEPELERRESTPVLDVKTLSPRPVTLQASYIADNNINDGHIFPPGAEFVKSWLMSNSGDVAWPETTELVFIGGDRLSSASFTGGMYHVGRVEPGTEVDVHAFDMKAPEEPGRYVSHWRLSDGEGKPFGDQLWCDINVEHVNVSGPSSMSSSSLVQMPSAAPEEAPIEPLEQHYVSFPAGIRSPGTLISSVETPSVSSVTELSDSGESDWEDARGVRAQHRRASNEFVFVDEDGVDV